MPPVRKVAYLTDVEGRWDKLVDFCAESPLVSLDAHGALRVSAGSVFVFGGDAVDRGPAGQRIIATLLAAKSAQPDQVVLLAGNRDINKLRLLRELDGHPPPRAPQSAGRVELLRFLLAQTMGARHAFEHRRAELGPVGDDDVVDSFLEELAPDGLLTRYLSLAALAHREGETLFVHGGVTGENFGLVPGRAERATTVDGWVLGLNAFYAERMDDFVARRLSRTGAPHWRELVAYQAPLAGSKLNQGSVVYARPVDDRGDPELPAVAVIAALAASGIRRVVVGHTPSGDCPALVRDETGFELLLADNSYGRIETGSRVTVDEGGLRVEGATLLDSGERAEVSYQLALGAASPLGWREAESGRLIKARLAGGDYLTFRARDGYEVEQLAMTQTALAGAGLVVARSLK